MKKKAFAVIAAFVLTLVYSVGSGFMKNTSVFIHDFRVSSDGQEITLHVGVSSSMGYIRDGKVRQQQGSVLYLDFYSAFGGLNGRLGAKDTFSFPLNEDTAIIAVYRCPGGYEEVLEKTADGTWQRIEL